MKNFINRALVAKKHLKLFFALFAMLALGVGNAWGENAPVNTVLWGENFAHFGTNTPSNAKTGTGTTIYDGASITYTQSSTSTKGYNEKLAGGTAPELLLSSSNQTWTISGIKTGGAIEMSLTFLSNRTTFDVIVSSTNLSVSGSQKSWTISLKDGQSTPETFDLIIKNTGSKNARIDNVSLNVTVAGTSSATPVDPTVTFSNGSSTVGQTLDLSTLWTSDSDGAVTYTVKTDGGTGATINGTSFTATAAGTCEVKASQIATSAYNAIEKTATITVTAPTPATITLSEAGVETSVTGKNVGDSYTLPTTSSQTCGDKTFVGWSTVEIATPGDRPTSKFYEPDATVTLAAEQTFYAVYATEEGSGSALTQVVDILNRELTGITDGSSTYSDWNGKIVTSSAVYAGNSAGGKNAIQLRSAADKAASGVITTSSGGKATNITIVWENSTQAGRTLNIYGKNTAYNEVADLRDDSKKGTLLGTIVKGTSTSLTIDEDYEYIALCSNSGAMYLTSVSITWTSGGGISYSNYTTSCDGSTEPVVSLTDEQLKWSAATATALKGADNNEFPTLTNELSVPVTYTSSKTSVATIETDGKITLVAPGTTTISAIFAGGEVSGTKYAAKTVTYTLTVKQLVSCADIYDLADDATFVLKDFVVTYVNGDYTYLKDATGYGVIYKNSYGLQAGDQVASGKLEGQKDTYKGLVEIIPTTTAADLNATSGIAPEPEVMTNTPTNADINKYVKFENVSFKYTNLNDTYKTNSGKLEGQTEYNIAFYNKFTSNVTFDTSKKYDVVGVVSIKDDAIEVYFISAEEVAEPTLNVKITNADFGKIAINGTAERTLTLNGSLLTKPVSLAIEGDYFTLASESVTPTAGNITDAKIKITYKPTAEGTHTATLKITSDELTEQTITLQGQAVQQHTVNFYVNKEKQTELAKKVLSGEKLTEIPTATSCDPLEYPTFIGWSDSEITGTTDVEPTDLLDSNTTITADCNYYAVFAKETTTSSSSESATMAYSGTTTNMTDGNNASTVGLDEALFTITSDKGGQGNHVGLNTAGDIRLYANKADGNGNILTIAMAEGYTITQISLAIKQNATFVVKANGQSISGIENVYDINHSSCSIQNTTIGATTQLRLHSITISYTTSTISKEYLTTCESATPTYTVTYNPDGGESTCETSVVVEQNGELTLCDAPTKKGHTFLKWKDQSDNEYEAGATITVSSNLTLTAQWQKESYKVTWMSLGEEVASANVEYNSQPTKPAEVPTYTCYGEKEFVGWTTKEIDGVGTPTNLYTDEFPVVTEPITYYAVFAGRSAEASITTNTLTITENLGQYKAGTITDDQGAIWNYYAGGSPDQTINLRNNSGEKSYLASPKFAGTVQSITAHVTNGSASARKVYLCSSAVANPSGGDLGETSIAGYNNSNVALVIADGKSFDQFYIQVSGGLQFKDIVVTSGIAAGAHIDYITSCDAVTSSISIDNISLCVGDVHTITATIKPATAASAVSYTIKENATDAISLSGNTITALKEGTATITATIANATDYAGTSFDFKVTVDAAPVTSKVVILAQHAGQWYAMKADYDEENKSLRAIPVTYVNGTLYNVADSEKEAIEWERTTRGNTATFKKGENYLIGTTGTDFKFGDIAFEWAVDGNLYLCDENKRTFIFNKAGYFKNYSTTNVSNGVAIDATYSSLPVVTAPVYETAVILNSGDNSTVISNNKEQTVNAIVNRSFTAEVGYYTLCVPFNMPASEIGTAYQLGSITKNVAGEGIIINLNEVEDIQAGVAYLVLPKEDMSALVVENAIIKDVDPTTLATVSTGAGININFTGIINGGGQTNGTTEYYVGDNGYLYNGTVDKLGLRAFFTITNTEGQAVSNLRARVVAQEDEATGVEDITAPEGQVLKVIENGQLIIIRNGEKYNVQGQRL